MSDIREFREDRAERRVRSCQIGNVAFDDLEARLIARGKHLGIDIATFQVTPEEIAAIGKRIVRGADGAWPPPLNAWSRFVFGIHFRHPHAMPELRAAAKAIWEGSGAAFQAEWGKIKPAEAPATFDEYLGSIDPFTAAKMRVNLIIKTFDNETLIAHMNQMAWSVADVSSSGGRFLTSDRPVCIHNLARPPAPEELFTSPIFRCMSGHPR